MSAAGSSKTATRKPVAQRFKLLEIIGRGKFGTVHKAVDVDTRQVIAIKILNLDTDSEEVKDIQQEIRFLSNLKSVPNITHYFGSYLNGHKLWILMDYCAGGSVRTLLKPGPLHEKYISVVARELFIALQFIHEHGVIHRDIKAANILISREGRVKLCDFGVAAQLTSTALKRTTMAGTPYWMAPEVITEGATYNAKADIWSTGITIYEMATGNPPYSDKDALRAMQLITQHEPPRLEGRQYGPLLKEIIAICLEEKPDLRPTAEDVLKSKFIKSSRTFSTTVLKEVIGKYLLWRDNKSNGSAGVTETNGEIVADDENSKQPGHDNDDGQKEYEQPLASNASIAESYVSSEENENIKWDFDSLKSAEYIIENDINLQNDDNYKFDDANYDTNTNTNHRDFTTSPYNRTFTIGNTIMNNYSSTGDYRVATATPTQIDSIVNSSIGGVMPSIKEPPESLLQLFQNDIETDSPQSNHNNTIFPNPAQREELQHARSEPSIVIPHAQQSHEPITTSNTLRQQISSPLVSIEIPNMDVIENEIQEREKQRSRTATINANNYNININHNNSENININLTANINSNGFGGNNHSSAEYEHSNFNAKNDQPLPIRKPTMTLGSARAPSPAKLLEQINTNLQPSPTKQTSPLHMKPLPVNPSQPLLQPLNGTHKSKPQINLAGISTHKGLMNNGPQTAPVSMASSAEMFDASLRNKNPMRIQMPVPISANTAQFNNIFSGAPPVEKNQFGFDVNAASSIPLAMTPVTERPHPHLGSPDRDNSKREISNDPNNSSTPTSSLPSITSLVNSSGKSSMNSSKLANPLSKMTGTHTSTLKSATSTPKPPVNTAKLGSNSSKLSLTTTKQITSLGKTANPLKSNGSSFANLERKMSLESGTKLQPQPHYPVTQRHGGGDEESNNSNGLVTGLGMMRMADNGKVSPVRVNRTGNEIPPGDKLHRLLSYGQSSMENVSSATISMVGTYYNNTNLNNIYATELDNMLGNMDDVLRIIEMELK